MNAASGFDCADVLGLMPLQSTGADGHNRSARRFEHLRERLRWTPPSRRETHVERDGGVIVAGRSRTTGGKP
jgi:hypothetical protein